MPDWLLQVAGMLFAAGATYGAIKGDLRALHERVRDAKSSADEAHRRIDQIFTPR